MGDDMEKFGGWPHTWEHCFRDGWLDNFFTAMESNHDWLEMIPPGEALAARMPFGRVDLPTASYTEMMEWVLPTPVRQQFHALQQEFTGRPDVRRFLRGGFWRGFFSKYAESNLLHKKMLRVSSKLEHLPPRDAKIGPKTAKGSRRLRAKAITHLLRAHAMTRTGTEFLAACTLHICERNRGGNWCEPKRLPTHCAKVRNHI